MATRQQSPATILFYFCLTLVTIFVASSIAWESYWIGTSLVVLVLGLPLIVYFCRPSVRQGFGLLFTLLRTNRSLARGDYRRAEELAREAVARADASSDAHDLGLGMALAALGEVYRCLGKLADAEPVLKQALKHYGEAVPYNPTRRATTLLSLGAIYISQGRFDEAEPVCREALTVLVNARNRDRPTAMLDLGMALAGQRRYEDAEREFRRVLDMLAAPTERGNPIGCVTLCSLADLYRVQGRLAEAEPLARRAVALVERPPAGPEDAVLARALSVLADVVRRQDHLDEAEVLSLRAQGLIEKALGPEHFSLDRCLATLARIRSAQGRAPEAESLYRRCLAILEQATPNHRERAVRMEEYAALLRELGCAGEAAEWDNRLNSLPASTASRNEQEEY